MSKPIPINTPPMRKSGVISSPKKNQPRSVPTTGWAKKVNEATEAGRCANAKFHRNMASAVEMMPRNRIPRMMPVVI